MNRISVALFSHPATAEPILARLQQAGIPAEVHSQPILSRMWFTSESEGGWRLDVPAADFERAEDLLLDWDAAERALQDAIRCPECRSLRVLYPQFALNSLMTNFWMGVGASLGLVEKHYYCEDCHFTWPKEGTRPRRDRPHTAPYYFIDGIEQTNLARPKSEAVRKAA